MDKRKVGFPVQKRLKSQTDGVNLLSLLRLTIHLLAPNSVISTPSCAFILGSISAPHEQMMFVEKTLSLSDVNFKFPIE